MKFRLITSFSLALLVVGSWPAWSASTTEELQRQLASLSSATDRVRFSGYFQASMSQSDTEIPYEAGAIGKENYIDDSLNTEAHNVVGIQLEVAANENVDIVAQLRADGYSNYNAVFPYTFIRWRMNDEVTLRIGRLRQPQYMLSEFVGVGYAYPWVSAPSEIYGVSPSTDYEGIDMIYSTYIGDYNLKIQPFMNPQRSKSTDPTGVTTSSSHARGMAFEFGNDVSSLFYTYSTGHVSVAFSSDVLPELAFLKQGSEGAANAQLEMTFGTSDINQAALDAAVAASGVAERERCTDDSCRTAWDTASAAQTASMEELFNTVKNGVIFGALGPGALDMGDPSLTPSEVLDNGIAELTILSDPDREKYYYRSGGFRSEPGDFLFMGEAINMHIDGLMYDTQSWYLTGGYRVSPRLLVHFTGGYSETQDNEDRLSPVTGRPGFTASVFDLQQRSRKLGVRYELFPGVALKADVEKLDDFGQTTGLFSPTTMGFNPSKTYTIYRASLDAVF